MGPIGFEPTIDGFGDRRPTRLGYEPTRIEISFLNFNYYQDLLHSHVNLVLNGKTCFIACWRNSYNFCNSFNHSTYKSRNSKASKSPLSILKSVLERVFNTMYMCDMHITITYKENLNELSFHLSYFC